MRRVALVVPVLACLAFLAVGPWREHGLYTSPPVPLSDASSAFYDAKGKPTFPALLSQNDKVLYEEIFRTQKHSEWKKADELISQLRDPLLVGHVLAERYLHHDYDTSSAELISWLNRYGDHPQAFDIYSLALAKAPALKKDLPAIRKPVTLTGYGDDSSAAWRTANSPLGKGWRKGLQAWKAGDKRGASRLFADIVNNKEALPSGMNAAAAYWAYRANNALANRAEATRYLRIAAKEPRSFYGILARKQLRAPLELDTTPIELSETDILEIIGEPSIRRAIALVRASRPDLAEKELRATFPQADDREKRRLLALAYSLDLASVEITMARQLGRDGEMLDFARYPMPNWKPHGGFTIDPALVYALARQESGFHTAAISRDGALGVMQLMPATASFMKKKNTTAPAGNVAEPNLNVTLGQNYIKHLLDNALVENNLFYLLAAYNAGPGRLQEWKASIGHDDDPLLFLESIPFAETRNYVMQVMANYWIYSEMSGLPSKSVYSLLNDRWPNYQDLRLLADNTAG